MTIVVKLVPSAPEPGPAARAAAALGVTLAPMHPGSADEELGRWFAGSCPGDEQAAAAALRELPGVEAAYVKPDEAAPA